MSLYTSAWGRPLQGMSQQPPKNRLDGQCSDQKNAIASAVRGLYKRNGATYLTELGLVEGSALKDKIAHFFNSEGQGFIIRIPPNSSSVFVTELFGGKETKEVQADTYITTDNPAEDLQLISIADTTFIVNRKVHTEEDTELSPPEETRAIVNVQFADYGRTYGLYIGGLLVSSFTTPTGKESEHITQVDTSYVARALFNNSTDNAPFIWEKVFVNGVFQFNFTQGGKHYIASAGGFTPATSESEFVAYVAVSSTGLGSLAGYTCTLKDNTIIITKNDGKPFEISTKDGADGQDVIAIQGRVLEVSKLPVTAPSGYVVEVTGNSGKAEPFYLKAENSKAGKIRWVETLAPSTNKGLLASTMPRTLVNTDSSNFTYQLAEWSPRSVGDTKSNPAPAFVQEGAPINNLGVFQNRLVVLAGESISYSKSGDFFDFYRTTVQELLDTDPIGVSADTDRVNVLYSQAILDGDLVFFGKDGQFLQAGDKPVTPENATIKHVSSFETLPKAMPVASGEVIFFPFDYGGTTGIREFYTDSMINTKRARPITEHVSRLIQGEARLLLANTTRDMLFVLAEPHNVVYLYQWVWQGDEKLQSAWGYWEFPAANSVLYLFLENNELFVVLQDAEKVWVEVLDLRENITEEIGFSVKLDSKRTIEFNKTNGVWLAPNDFGAIPTGTLLQGVGCEDAGAEIDFRIEGEFIATDDYLHDSKTTVTCIYGVPYDFVYEPTMPFILDQSERVIDTDRLTISDVNVSYDLLGEVMVAVINDYGHSRNYNFTGRQLGKINNTVGLKDNIGGSFKIPIRQQSDRVTFKFTSNDPYEFQLRGLEWRGRFIQRGRRV